MFKYTKAKSLVFEKELNALHQLPIGSYLGQSLQIISKSESYWKQIVESLKFLKFLFSKKIENNEPRIYKKLNSFKKYILITLIENDNRYKGFILPVCKALLEKNESVILICPSEFLNEKELSGTNLIKISWDSFKAKPINNQFSRIRLFLFFRTFIQKKFSVFTAFRLFMLCRQQMNCSNNFYLLFNKLKIDFVLTEYDRSTKAAPLIAVANLKKIPTFTLIHGSVIPPDSYYPFIAKKVLTWGNKQIEIFNSLGYSKEIFTNVGNNRIYKINYTEQNNLKSALNIGGNVKEKVVTLITNNLDIKERLKLASVFMNAVIKIGWIGIIKLHPSEKKGEYHTFNNHLTSRFKILSSNEIGNIDLSVITDVFVNHNSVMGIELLFQQKPVVILDCIKSNLGIGLEMVNEGACLIAHNEEELGGAILNAKTNFSINKMQTNTYVHQYFYSNGVEATENIINTISSSFQTKFI